MRPGLNHNIPKLYAYAFFQTFLVIIPVIVPYWQQKGLSLQDVFVLQGIFGAALILFDVPAGYLADLLGRKKIMVIGSLISALGFQFLWFGRSFFEFAVYEIILGLGLSLQSGCDVAILYASLEKNGQTVRPAVVLGRRLSAMTFGEGLASLLGGVLALSSLDWAAYATAVFSWLPLLIALTVEEPDSRLLSRESHWANIRSILRGVFAHSRLLTLVVLSFIFYGFATYCAIWSFQPYWQSRGLSTAWFGYLWAANCFVVALCGRYAHGIEIRIGSVASIIVIAVLPVIGYFGMGLTAGLAGLVFGLAFPVCRAMNQVLFQDAINSRVPSEMRATVNSIGSLGVRALFLIFGPMIGFVLDHQGPDAALRSLGWVYFVGAFALILPLLRERRHFRISRG